MTPLEPADPMDCNRYPDSPFCGKLPFSPWNGIRPQIIIDSCNIGVELGATFGYVKLPPLQFVYRFPSCRATPPPQSQPQHESCSAIVTPQNTCGSGQPLCVYVRTRGIDYDEYITSNGLGWELAEYTGRIEKVEHHGGHGGNAKVVIRAKKKYSTSANYLADREGGYGYSVPVGTDPLKVFTSENEGLIEFEVSTNSGSFITGQNYFDWRINNGDTLRLIGQIAVSNDYELFVSKQSDYENNDNRSFDEINWIIRDVEEAPVFRINSPIRQITVETLGEFADFYGRYWAYNTQLLNISSMCYESRIFCDDFIPSPPPPQNKKCKCMCCDNNDQLLRLILKRIGTPKTVEIFDEDLDRKGTQKAKKKPEDLNTFLQLALQRIEIANRIIGIASFPVTVPDTVIEPYKEGIFGEIFKFINGKYVLNFNINVTDEELDKQLESQIKRFYGLFGNVVGSSMGYLVCGAIPGALSFAFHPTLAAAIMRDLDDEAREEVLGQVNVISRTAVQTLINAELANKFKSSRRFLKKNPDNPFDQFVRGMIGEKNFKKWGDSNQPSWTIKKNIIENKVESLPGGWKEFAEEALEAFGDSCIESGFIIANNIAEAKNHFYNYVQNEAKLLNSKIDRLNRELAVFISAYNERKEHLALTDSGLLKLITENAIAVPIMTGL
ncbi:hypothetical protein BLD44_017280 [Mastigocladus laminosus UU774]|nr:hypothetical protein BLD44_017280 [Mastigocladus laminosus UU774]